MIRLKPNRKTCELSIPHSNGTALPIPGQHAKSMLNQVLRTTEIRDYPPVLIRSHRHPPLSSPY